MWPLVLFFLLANFVFLIAYNKQVFEMPGNSLIIKSDTHAHMKVYYQNYELKLKIERLAQTGTNKKETWCYFFGSFNMYSFIACFSFIVNLV